MMSEPLPNWHSEIGLHDLSPPRFFRTVNELDDIFPPVPQAHALRRAFRRMGLDGILCFENAPIVYFKVVSEFRHEELRRLQLRVWNQGLVPVLVVLGPKEVRIYSGLVPPSGAESDRLVKTLDRVADALEIGQLALALESGEFFRVHGRAFDPNLRVDRRLLENLSVARERLRHVTRDPLAGSFLDALLCRVVFTCYLIDREVIGPTDLERVGAMGASRLRDVFDHGRSLREAGRLLYDLFIQLQGDFNGDLFGDLDGEFAQIEDPQLDILRRLLCGEELASGQLSFLDYDFSVIPIETISAIYEHFLPEGRRESGAVYTPRFLADLVIDVATQGCSSLLGKRFLDPACGSGIFLVGLFHRLAEEWRHNHPGAHYAAHAEALIHLLQSSLFGIDRNETACKIASFSLYLALLDQLDPPDIRKLQKQGKFLPPLVFQLKDIGKPGAGSTILHASFGQADPALPPNGFDLVIGNPPWVSRGSAEGEEAKTNEEWPYDTKAPIAQKQLAQRFIWKAPRHLNSEGIVCFLLPHGILFNHDQKALRFQRKWIESYDIRQVINLSDLRYQLFEGAIRPALIITYGGKVNESEEGHSIVSYFTPKTDWLSFLSDILVVSPEDRKEVALRRVLRPLEQEEAATVWKERFWGTPRDWKLLDRLSMLPRLGAITGQPHKGKLKRWTAGQGFQPLGINDDPEKSKDSWSSEELFVEAESGFDLLLFKSDCRPPNPGRLRRRPKADAIFDAPHVLVTKGLRVAYADFRVIFQHSVQGIHGPAADEDLLRFLAVVLRSPLAHYFLFHTVANWGAERPEIHLEELLRFPFPLPENTDSPKVARAIVREIAAETRALSALMANSFDRSVLVKTFIDRIASRIYDYYDIDDLEKHLIDDTVKIAIPSATPRRPPAILRRAGVWRPRLGIPALDPSTKEDRAAYLTLLGTVLNEWSSGGPYRATGHIAVSQSAGLGLVQLQRAQSEDPPEFSESEQVTSGELEIVLKRMQEQVTIKRGTLFLARDLKIFEGTTLYIVKSLSHRFWTKTAALNDADEIAAAILSPFHA